MCLLNVKMNKILESSIDKEHRLPVVTILVVIKIPANWKRNVYGFFVFT